MRVKRSSDAAAVIAPSDQSSRAVIEIRGNPRVLAVIAARVVGPALFHPGPAASWHKSGAGMPEADAVAAQHVGPAVARWRPNGRAVPPRRSSGTGWSRGRRHLGSFHFHSIPFPFHSIPFHSIPFPCPPPTPSFHPACLPACRAPGFGRGAVSFLVEGLPGHVSGRGRRRPGAGP